MVQSAIAFQAEPEQLIVDLEQSRMPKLNGRFTAAEIVQALADGGPAVNQGLPPIAAEDLSGRYRQMCEMMLYGCAAMPKAGTSRPKTSKRKISQRK